MKINLYIEYIIQESGIKIIRDVTEKKTLQECNLLVNALRSNHNFSRQNHSIEFGLSEL